MAGILASHPVFADPEGLGGFESIVNGDDIARRTYSASYLASAGKPHFEVPDRGYVNITVRITQGGRSVAEISERWALEPKVRWEVDIDRAPYSQSNGITHDLENPECQWFWCHRVWRSPIAEGAAHCPNEAQ